MPSRTKTGSPEKKAANRAAIAAKVAAAPKRERSISRPKPGQVVTKKKR